MERLYALGVAAKDLRKAHEQETRAWQGYSARTGQRDKWRVNTKEVDDPSLLAAWDNLTRAQEAFREALDKVREEYAAY